MYKPTPSIWSISKTLTHSTALPLISITNTSANKSLLNHDVSDKYIQRYINEAVYRWNTRNMGESLRFAHMFNKSIGKCNYLQVKMSAKVHYTFTIWLPFINCTISKCLVNCALVRFAIRLITMGIWYNWKCIMQLWAIFYAYESTKAHFPIFDGTHHNYFSLYFSLIHNDSKKETSVQ